MNVDVPPPADCKYGKQVWKEMRFQDIKNTHGMPTVYQWLAAATATLFVSNLAAVCHGNSEEPRDPMKGWASQGQNPPRPSP